MQRPGGRSRGRPPFVPEKLPTRFSWDAHFHIQTQYGYGHNRKSPALAAIRARFEKINSRPPLTADPSRSTGCPAGKPVFLLANLLPHVAGRREPAPPVRRYLL